MKQILFIALLLIGSTFGMAQTTVEVTTGQGYVNDVYYSFEEGSLITAPRDEWDLAFSTDQFDVNILGNHASGVEVYTYPDGGIEAWESMDLSAMGSWAPMYNSIVDIYSGAFMRNLDYTNPFDFGWGKYDPATHVIAGDSLYVVKTVSGALKKMWIVEKNPNTGVNSWEIKFANADGSDEKTIMIECDPYSEKNFVHYSIDNDMLLDREPESANWELKFTKYHDYTIPYNVTGVTLNATRVLGLQVDDVYPPDFEDYDESAFNDSLIVIGSDWKAFNGTGYSLDEDRVYFTKVYDAVTNDSTYWKLYFTGFTGSSEGKYTFVQQQLGSSGLSPVEGIGMMEVYPNPAIGYTQVFFDNQESLKLTLMDLNGRVVWNKNITNTGFQKEKIMLDGLKKGVYSISLDSSAGRMTRKIIVE